MPITVLEELDKFKRGMTRLITMPVSLSGIGSDFRIRFFLKELVR
ncbi:MAG: hypothetical protein ACLU4J_09815 [Butyricimonas paravirosa]